MREPYVHLYCYGSVEAVKTPKNCIIGSLQHPCPEIAYGLAHSAAQSRMLTVPEREEK
jgi:hypothetical protein